MRNMYEKEYADKKRGSKVSDIEVGDKVIIRQSKRNKLTTPFETEPHEVVDSDMNKLNSRNIGWTVGNTRSYQRGCQRCGKRTNYNGRCDGGTCKAIPGTSTDGSCHTRHAFCPTHTNRACSVRTNVEIHITGYIYLSCFS